MSSQKCQGRYEEDRQEWAEAYDAEHQGFYEYQTLTISRPEPGAKILGTTTHTEYKTVNGQFTKRKVRLRVMEGRSAISAGRALCPTADEEYV